MNGPLTGGKPREQGTLRLHAVREPRQQARPGFLLRIFHSRQCGAPMDVRLGQAGGSQRGQDAEFLDGPYAGAVLPRIGRNFLSPGIATMDELMETLFWMDEENRGLFHLFLLNDSESETVGITIRDKKTMSYLQEWMGKKQKLGDGRITEEEYLEWKLHWPENKRKTEYKTV